MDLPQTDTESPREIAEGREYRKGMNFLLYFTLFISLGILYNIYAIFFLYFIDKIYDALSILDSVFALILQKGLSTELAMLLLAFAGFYISFNMLYKYEKEDASDGLPRYRKTMYGFILLIGILSLLAYSGATLFSISQIGAIGALIRFVFLIIIPLALVFYYGVKIKAYKDFPSDLHYALIALMTLVCLGTFIIALYENATMHNAIIEDASKLDAIGSSNVPYLTTAVTDGDRRNADRIIPMADFQALLENYKAADGSYPKYMGVSTVETLYLVDPNNNTYDTKVNMCTTGFLKPYGTCIGYLFPTSGVLRSVSDATSYFYIPFHGTAEITDIKYGGKIDNYILGVCLEGKKVEVFSNTAKKQNVFDDPLYTITKLDRFVTNGSAKLTVRCS
jgi:hypothetical protein